MKYVGKAVFLDVQDMLKRGCTQQTVGEEVLIQKGGCAVSVIKEVESHKGEAMDVYYDSVGDYYDLVQQGLRYSIWYCADKAVYMVHADMIRFVQDDTEPVKNELHEESHENITTKGEKKTMKANNSTIYFAKTKEGAKIPSKRIEDGAFDIYACFDEDYMVIKPHATELIPTGLASAFSTDYVAILKERGSTGTKGMIQHSGVIDSGFRGEWFVPIGNGNDRPIIIAKETADIEQVQKELSYRGHGEAIVYPYEKAISQCIVVEVPKQTIQEIPYEELLKFESERGTGALGSSGK